MPRNLPIVAGVVFFAGAVLVIAGLTINERQIVDALPSGRPIIARPVHKPLLAAGLMLGGVGILALLVSLKDAISRPPTAPNAGAGAGKTADQSPNPVSGEAETSPPDASAEATSDGPG